jgi:hypothetical protein
MNDRQLPCGNCSSGGVYAFEAIVEGVAVFGDCLNHISALRTAPRCKHRPKQICMGARDFIVTCDFPISEAMKAEYPAPASTERGTP